MISELLQNAHCYETKYEQFIRPEERPLFHITPRVGWMNDPNGFSFYKGEYHIFYQYNPYDIHWGPMYWGHAVSNDLINWRYLPTVLAPDKDYDNGGCFSGSAIELPDGRQLLMYTGDRQEKEKDGRKTDIQTQCLAIGDGTDYQKYENNPVLDRKDIPEGFSTTDFRDPKLWYDKNDNKYYCVVGNLTDDKSGAILLFSSDDALHWSFCSILERCNNQYGLMWECPDFFELDGKHIIITSPQDMSSLGLEFHNGNCTLCIIGSYEKKQHKFHREYLHAIDYGIDFYAPQTLLSPDGRRIMIGWMQNWDTAIAPEGAKWFGQMSIPRELVIRNNRLYQMPVRELEQYRKNNVSYRNLLLQNEMTLKGVYGRVIDLSVSVHPSGLDCYRFFRLKLASGSQHYTMLTYNPATSILHFDRSHSGFIRDFVHERDMLVRSQHGELKLRIIMDRFSIEIFVNDGEQALSATIYTPQSAEGISFDADGIALIDVEKYDLM